MVARRGSVLLPVLLALAACRGPAAPERPPGALEAAAQPDAPSPSDVEPDAQAWTVIGSSLEGRDLLARTFGRGPRRVYWIGGIHGSEPEGGRELDALLELLGDAEVIARATVRVLQDANPDGTAAGARGNARGVDLNRNFPAGSFRPSRRSGAAPLSEPEARALHDDLEAFAPHLVIVLHAAPDGPYVNFDGPADDAAARFAAAARELDPRWRVVPDMGYPTPGSLGTLIGKDRGLPILTLELRRGDPPERVRAGLVAGAAALLRELEPSAE